LVFARLLPLTHDGVAVRYRVSATRLAAPAPARSAFLLARGTRLAADIMG
jgi:hypothetical protein